MKSSDLTWRIGRIAGIAAILSLSASILASWSFYPGPYGPFTNWISDLGNPANNPDGAKFMNAGLILTGILFFPFCLGLYRWHGDEKIRKASFVLAMIAGFTAALSMVMIGTFPENYAVQHQAFALGLFVSLGLFLFLSAWHLVACSKDPKIRGIAYFGFAAGLVDVAFGLVFYDHIFEWVAAFASLGYVALLAYGMYRKS